MAELEKEKKKLEETIQNPNIAMEEMMNQSERLGDVINIIDKKEMRWLELD